MARTTCVRRSPRPPCPQTTIVAHSPGILLFLQPAMIGADTAFNWRHHMLRRHFQAPSLRQCDRTGGLRIGEGLDFLGHYFRELGIALGPSSRNLEETQSHDALDLEAKLHCI